MSNNVSVFYKESFRSLLREASTWLQVSAILLALFIIGGLIAQLPWMTDAFIKPLFFAGFGCWFAGSFFKMTKSRAEIHVSSHELRIHQEGQEEIFTKKDITSVFIGTLSSGGSFGISWMVRFQNESGREVNTACFIKPHHFSWSKTSRGVVLITPKANRPIFIPAKQPEVLLEALLKII